MSKRRKRELEREKRKKKFFISLSLLFFILTIVFSFGFVYFKFFAQKPIEAFIPDDVISFFLIDIDPDSEQNVVLKKLGLRFGDENFLNNFLEDLIFPGLRESEIEIDQEILFGWRGKKVAVGSIRVSPIENISIFIIQVKNYDLAQKFLSIFEENLQKAGHAVSFENFRGHKIIQSKGLNEISFTLLKDYLLISEKADGIKKMIDTELGRFSSLAQSKNYQLPKNKLKEKESIVFSYIDLLEFLKMISALSKNFDPDVFSKLDLGNKSYLGIAFIPHEDSIEAKIYSKSTLFTKRKRAKSKPIFAEKIPADILFYYEGSDFRPHIEGLFFGQFVSQEEAEAKKEALKRLIQLEFGFNLDEDLLALLDQKYVFFMLSESTREKIEVVAIFDVKDKPNLFGKLGRLEHAIVNLLNKYVIKSENKPLNFTDYSYQNYKFRYLNLPDNLTFDISYGILSDYLFLATSDRALRIAIQSIEGQIDPTLSQDSLYKAAFTNLNKDSDVIFYCDIQRFIKFLNYFVDFDYGKLDKRLRALNSLSFTKQEKGRDNFYNLFFKVK